jgi:hypothetical protein
LRATRGVTLALALVAPASWIASTCSAEIFKCAEKNGLTRYQNFPCSMDSLGLPSPVPAEGGTGSAARVDSGSPSSTPAAKPAAHALASAPGSKAPPPAEPRAGMTQDEVTALWGLPEDTIRDELKEGRREVWRYADGRSVHFDNKRRVWTVQRH